MGILNSNNDDSSGSLFVDINVTPMVDVMLVLLIIFMVTAPFMIETLGVNLPKGRGAAAQAQTAPITISIDEHAKVFIAGQEINLADLKDFLQDNPKVKAGEAVFVEADKNTLHGTLVSVMSKAQEAGVEKINIIMEKP
jgi:biopolymer transport protein TolR